MRRDVLIVNISIKSILTNLLLVLIKITTGLFTKSTAIVLDGLNNLSDMLSSTATIIGIKLSNKKPDKEHPYGHGRIEYFTTIIVAIIVLAAGVIAFAESVGKIIKPIDPLFDFVTVILIIIAIITKIGLGSYVKNRGKKINSDTLVASGNDALFDAFLSLSTLISVIIFMIFKINIEGYIGLLISIFIAKNALEMIKNPINEIIGIRINDELKKEIIKDISKFKEVHGVYDLIIHSYGPVTLIGSAHIEVNDDLTAKEVHKLSKKIEKEIYEKYDIVMTIGIYTTNNTSQMAREVKKYIIQLIKKYPTILELHGLYIDEEYKEITFDLIYDYDEQNIEKINQKIINSLKTKYKGYNFYIVVDKDI